MISIALTKGRIEKELVKVLENGEIKNIDYISSLNFRISSQRDGCSYEILKSIINEKEGTIFNTLIVSPPGRRKNYNFKRFDKKYK